MTNKRMKVEYTYDDETMVYYANGASVIGYVSGAYDDIGTMIQDIQIQIESIYDNEDFPIADFVFKRFEGYFDENRKDMNNA